MRPRAFADAEPRDPAFELGVEPALNGAGRDAQVAGDVLVRPVAVGQSDNLEAVPEFMIGGVAKRTLQRALIELRRLDTDHGCRGC